MKKRSQIKTLVERESNQDFVGEFTINQPNQSPSYTADNTIGSQPTSTRVSRTYNFPITLDTLDRIASRGENGLKFVQNSSIQSNLPIPVYKSRSYFEIEIKRLDPISELKMGIATKLNKELNTSAGCFLSIKNESQFCINTKRVVTLNPLVLNEGDYIGCFYSQAHDPKVFFVKNNEVIGFSLTERNLREVYPTLIASGGFEIGYNFGNIPFNYQKANNLEYGLSDSFTVIEVPPMYSK